MYHRVGSDERTYTHKARDDIFCRSIDLTSSLLVVESKRILDLLQQSYSRMHMNSKILIVHRYSRCVVEVWGYTYIYIARVLRSTPLTASIASF